MPGLSLVDVFTGSTHDRGSVRRLLCTKDSPEPMSSIKIVSMLVHKIGLTVIIFKFFNIHSRIFKLNHFRFSCVYLSLNMR